jgi:hypothetical protein
MKLNNRYIYIGLGLLIGIAFFFIKKSKDLNTKILDYNALDKEVIKDYWKNHERKKTLLNGDVTYGYKDSLKIEKVSVIKNNYNNDLWEVCISNDSLLDKNCMLYILIINLKDTLDFNPVFDINKKQNIKIAEIDDIREIDGKRNKVFSYLPSKNGVNNLKICPSKNEDISFEFSFYVENMCVVGSTELVDFPSQSLR